MPAVTSSQYEAIIIGSGAGGLAAALRIANAGRRVLVVEAAQQFGGLLNPFARKGFWFDTGLHYVGEAGRGGLLTELLDGLGVDARFDELDPSRFDRYVFGQFELSLCKGRDRYMQRLVESFPAERDAIARFFRILRRVDLAFSAASGSLYDRLRAVRSLLTALRWSRATLGQMLGELFRDPLLRAVIAGPCGDLGLPPRRLSALCHIALLCHYLGGAYYPRGGSGGFRDALVRRLSQLGGELVNNGRVTRVNSERGRACGVQCADGRRFRASVVVSNAAPCATMHMAGLDGERERAHDAEFSLSSFMVFVGARGDDIGAAVGDANVWHYDSPDIDRIYARLEGGALPGPQMLFITVPTRKDRSMTKAPAGHHTVELITLCSARPFQRWFAQRAMKRGASYEALKRELAQPLLALAERYIPGLGRRIVTQEVATPATTKHFVSAPHGAMYGWAHTPAQALWRRYGHSTALDGLFVCGASSISGGVYPCLKSGVCAGALAVAYLAKSAPAASVRALAASGLPVRALAPMPRSRNVETA